MKEELLTGCELSTASFLAAGFGRGGRGGDEGLREHAADVFAEQGSIAAK